MVKRVQYRFLPKVILVSMLTLAALANESGYIVLQTGKATGDKPIHAHGLYGQGQLVAVMDTGLDVDSCYFAEANGTVPPVNVRLDERLVDMTRRKVIAYNLLYSCEENPGAEGCETPADSGAWDNQGHGTHAAAGVAADRGDPIVHDFGDAIAPAARLIVQDGGYIGGDACSSRPGFGCPVRSLTPLLERIWEQGARVQSNSWGDRQGVSPDLPPPTGNYTRSAGEIDSFVKNHPEMVIVFNSGNAGSLGTSSQSSPGNAKNTIQVGAAYLSANSLRIPSYSGVGPSRDGRIKPDLVGPTNVVGADTSDEVGNCDFSVQGGTSFASPPVAGAAALVRQYYEEGWYPSGTASPVNGFVPSSALVKATLVASTVPVQLWETADGVEVNGGLPSYEQGFGFPVLENVLVFAGDSRTIFVEDRNDASGLREGDVATFRIEVSSNAELRLALAWIDPQGTPSLVSDITPQLVNDLDLVVTTPQGMTLVGNERLLTSSRDQRNNLETVRVDSPSLGEWTVRVEASRLGEGPRQGFALVIAGDITRNTRRRPIRRR